MSFTWLPATRRPLAVAAVFAAIAALILNGAAPAQAVPVLPTPHANFDYQIGDPYTPPSGVEVVSRDRTASPAAGLYNICYVNAFQVQPGESGNWPSDLLLRDAQGDLVVDEDWGEPLLDIRTSTKRASIAAIVGGWIDDCATDGFDAIEPDNYDSYTRSQGLITGQNARDYIALLASHAHSQNLAIAQKNTVEFSSYAASLGLDFAIAEECGEYEECGDYVDYFDDNVIVIEYSSSGLSYACSNWGSTLSIVRRDMDVSTPSSGSYIRQTC